MRRTTSALMTTLSTTIVAVVLTAAPALAGRTEDGESVGESLGVGPTLLWFVVAPAVVFALICLAVLIPEARRRPRYRPARGWSAEPLWFAGPEDPVAAVESAPARAGEVGGARGSW